MHMFKSFARLGLQFRIKQMAQKDVSIDEDINLRKLE